MTYTAQLQGNPINKATSIVLDSGLERHKIILNFNSRDDADAAHYFLCEDLAARAAKPAEQAELDSLKRICAESYQVVGSLASSAGLFDHPAVIKALDNLSNQELTHDDVLPFVAEVEQAELSDADLLEILKSVDPETKRLPQGLKMFARAVLAAKEKS